MTDPFSNGDVNRLSRSLPLNLSAILQIHRLDPDPLRQEGPLPKHPN